MEFIDLLRYFGALLLVLAMVGGAGLLARRFGVPGVTKASSEKRLAIVETLMVGPRQRLFIVRRDDVEHLVLSGPDGATVIEAGISAPSGLRSAGAATATTPFDASHKGETGL
jgi:flagellar protein FliO/FliZ